MESPEKRNILLDSPMSAGFPFNAFKLYPKDED